ncbi:hypothetical protein AVEN_50772-1 [Araneus ventricosus]|uniref:Mos1 transposase HTH domain-containing protein n=1 Tax=Araneus ventricosus TaxID=182803 RepID=A0A4Y2MF38_ARAVE|nr:hypothetical protein AVEN_50772-1 [Araneus ventricosus]
MNYRMDVSREKAIRHCKNYQHEEQLSNFFAQKESMLHKFNRRMKEVYGEQCLAYCTIFRWCQRYEEGRVNIKDLPHPGQEQVVTDSAMISAWMSSCGRIVGSPHVKLLLNCR